MGVRLSNLDSSFEPKRLLSTYSVREKKREIKQRRSRGPRQPVQEIEKNGSVTFFLGFLCDFFVVNNSTCRVFL